MRHTRTGTSQGWQAMAASLALALVLAAPAPAQTARAIAPVVAPVAGVVSSGAAPSLSERAAQIDTLLSRGQTEAAIDAGRQFLRAVTERAGFAATNARLTVAPAEGFGVFEPRADGVYRIGDPVFAYVEVNGFSLTPQADGRNQLLFDVAFTLDSPDGRQMTDDLIPMGEVRIDTHGQPLDAFFHLTYRVTGAEGPFRLRTLVVDRATGRQAQFVLPVEFRAEPAPGASK